MIYVGWNYGNKTKCPLCKAADDKQEHIFECSKINDSSNDATGDICDTNFMKNIENALRKREIALEKTEATDNMGSQQCSDN